MAGRHRDGRRTALAADSWPAVYHRDVEASESRTITLHDGRRLGYAQWGDPAGHPLIYCHGWPSSRLEGRLAHRAGAAAAVRVISPDRPGIGLSDYRFRRTMTDWPDDVAELADALGLARFSVLGASGGAPYAAACAWKLRRRITGAGLIAGIGPIDAPGATVGMSRMNRWLLRIVGRLPLGPTVAMGLTAALARRPERLLNYATVAAVDRPYWNQMRKVLEPAIAEAFRRGGRGQARELRLLARPWGFRLEDIEAPVRLWHGERDPNAPVTMARHIAAVIPTCRATYYPDEGHLFFVGEQRLTEILRTLRP